MKTGARSILVAAAAVFGACGGGSSSTSSGGSCTPGQSAAVSIAAAGVTPKAVCILPGGTVTFTNNDSVSHDIEKSAAAAAACAALNLGPIAAGQAATAMLSTAATCTFEDSTRSGNAAFQGTVAVTTGPATGPGY